MIKKKKFLKRVFAFVGVLSILFVLCLPFSALTFPTAEQAVNYLDISAFKVDTSRGVTRIAGVDTSTSTLELLTVPANGQSGALWASQSPTLRECMPYASVGETYYFISTVNGIPYGFYLDSGIWIGSLYVSDGGGFTITEALLNSKVLLSGIDQRYGALPEDAYFTYQIAFVTERTENINYSFMGEYKQYFDQARQDGYDSGYEEGYDKGEEVGKEQYYTEYLNRNTIFNPRTARIHLYWDSRQYISSDTAYNLGFWDFPVYDTVLDNNLYPFDGYSFNTSLITKEMTNFDGVPKTSSGQFFDGLCGFSVYLNTKTQSGSYSFAKDLPLVLSLGEAYTDLDVVTVWITIPEGYTLPPNAEEIDDGYYVVRHAFLASSFVEGTLTTTLQESFGLDPNTPVQAMQITFWTNYSEVMRNDMDNGKSVLIADSANDPAYIAGTTIGKNQGIAQGREEGFAAGVEQGNKEGYDIGYKEGKVDGFGEGYAAGLEVGELTFTGLITAVIDAPVSVFASMFNFEVLGVNLLNFLTSILSVMIVIAVVKVVIPLI